MAKKAGKTERLKKELIKNVPVEQRKMITQPVTFSYLNGEMSMMQTRIQTAIMEKLQSKIKKALDLKMKSGFVGDLFDESDFQVLKEEGNEPYLTFPVAYAELGIEPSHYADVDIAARNMQGIVYEKEVDGMMRYKVAFPIVDVPALKEDGTPSGERRQNIYLHMTHVPLLVAENMASLLLTEESVQPVISQTMFTPHVHFMNTAPRSVCNMLENRSPENNRKIAMAALLNHATVAIKDDATIGLYKENRAWMEAVTQYDRFHAPGEGYTSADNPNVGVSFYESRDGSSMAVVANLTTETVTVSYTCNGKFAKQGGTLTLKPLEMQAIRKK